MPDFRVNSSVLLHYPRPQVFEFFSLAENLDLLTPPWLRFSILTPLPIDMKAGARIAQDDCKVRKLVSRGGRWSALGGRHRSWPARAWTSWEETIPPGAGRSAQC